MRRCGEEDWDLSRTLPAGARTSKKKRLISPHPWGKLGPALAGSAGTKLPTLFPYVLTPSPLLVRSGRSSVDMVASSLHPNPRHFCPFHSPPTFPLRSHTFSLHPRVMVPHSSRSCLPALPFSTVLPALFPVLPLLSPCPSVLLPSSGGLWHLDSTSTALLYASLHSNRRPS